MSLKRLVVLLVGLVILASISLSGHFAQYGQINQQQPPLQYDVDIDKNANGIQIRHNVQTVNIFRNTATLTIEQNASWIIVGSNYFVQPGTICNGEDCDAKGKIKILGNSGFIDLSNAGIIGIDSNQGVITVRANLALSVIEISSNTGHVEINVNYGTVRVRKNQGEILIHDNQGVLEDATGTVKVGSK